MTKRTYTKRERRERSERLMRRFAVAVAATLVIAGLMGKVQGSRTDFDGITAKAQAFTPE